MQSSVRSLIFRAAAAGLRRRPKRTVSTWADANRVLTLESSAEPGPYRTSRTPYVREPQDALGPDHPAKRVVVMKGSRPGFSEVGNNWIGYIVDDDPGPILMSYPTLDIAKRVSKVRIQPMFDNCPSLREKVSGAIVHDARNTMLYKKFTNGQLMMIGAKSANALRETTVRFLYLDEVDGYDLEAGQEGSTTALLERRTATYRRRKIFMISSPTLKGASRIHVEFLRGDQRRYFIPCLTCKHMDYLTWNGRDWLNDEGGAVHHSIGYENNDPKTAHIVCSKCRARTPEVMKGWMIDNGEWRATAEASDPETTSFHLSSLYSPFESWSDHVKAFLEAKRDPTKLRVFVNQILGEPYEDRGEAAPTVSELLSRPRTPAGVVPAGVGILVAGVDVHKDRLELQVEGYGAGEESWVIYWQAFYGNPETDQVWLELDTVLREPLQHENGQRLVVERVLVDAGYLSDEVYRFTKPREPWVFAAKGVDERDRETGHAIVGRASNKGNRQRANLFPVRTDAAKDKVFGRFRVRSPGPGYMHFSDGLDVEWFEQLTAEKKVPQSRGFTMVYQWKKIRERNEAFDLKVLCLAALYTCGEHVIRDLAARAAALAVKVDPEAQAAPAREVPRPPSPYANWMKRR
jgi:phage terminase large subunit GpA-like protein